MAKKQESMLDEIRKIKRRISLRLYKAKLEGRYLEELKAMEKKGWEWYTSFDKKGKKKHKARVS